MYRFMSRFFFNDVTRYMYRDTMRYINMPKPTGFAVSQKSFFLKGVEIFSPY